MRKTADTMDATDWAQLAAKFSGFARLAETILLQIEQGLLPQDAMGRLGYEGWSRINESPKFACVWPLIRDDVSSAFRDFVEGAQNFDAIDCTSFDLPQSLW
jgi:hypothetical protein